MTLSLVRSALVMACAAALVAAAGAPVTAMPQSNSKPQVTTRPLPPAAPSDVAAPPADAVTTASGLATKVIVDGKGKDHPKPTDSVTVNYTGWYTTGAAFDSSIVRGKPSVFPVNRVIPGFSEALQLMVVGEKRRAWIPEALAYKGAEGKPKGMLVFEVELISIEHALEAPVTPADVAAPPADATKTRSGLYWKELKSGTGTVHPKSYQTVKVHYSGWTTDGKMFDSSIVRGQAISFPLDQVIAGWTEGVQLMVEGQKCRFWIPEGLAYKGQAGMPKGMLVFDVELIGISK